MKTLYGAFVTHELSAGDHVVGWGRSRSEAQEMLSKEIVVNDFLFREMLDDDMRFVSYTELNDGAGETDRWFVVFRRLERVPMSGLAPGDRVLRVNNTIFAPPLKKHGLLRGWVWSVSGASMLRPFNKRTVWFDGPTGQCKRLDGYGLVLRIV